MILPFSTQLNGKPTYFVEKILAGLLEKGIINLDHWHQLMAPQPIYKEPKGEVITGYGFLFDRTDVHRPKLHTIREDKNNRWKAGNKIDFFINCRQPNMFRFAPVLPVVRTQRIFMTYAWNDIIQISVGNRELWGHERLELALNDGFDTWEDFFNYFYPIIERSKDKCFSGKIIHWTDLRY